ncbi:GDP-mannose pyrophosphorylase [Streptomyces tateyamensis]|uniref:GDP-mannose pyrophosphorylase n=1 Tax=Streptomyces tateyamensis TaxID=565073 RepID=A0A2V4N1K4_9ACTN|nr:NDP-sugar synthase [Streptomyces tateyamensis]PYC68723.1 GDP-mannose pyrophosphorylase [Streptomyces tateyamensis]
MTQAIMLVGGQGTRLRPLTTHTPKPMLPVAGVPFIAHQLARAAAAGVTRVVLATSYLAEVFEEHFADGTPYGLELVYLTEVEPLGTGGAIRNAAEGLTCGPDEPVLIFNGDILSGLDIAALRDGHVAAGADVTLHLTRVEDPRAFGLVPTDENGRVLEFLEKPETPEQIVTDQINAGCYVFTRSVIDRIPAGRVVSVERETFPELLATGALVRGVVDTSYWLDLGTPAAFVRGSADLVLGRVDSPAVPGPTGEALVLSGAAIDPAAVLSSGTVVADGASVAAGAIVEGSVVLPGAVVAADAVVKDSIVGAFAVIGERTVVDGAVIGDGAVVESDNELPNGIRIACGVRLPMGAVRTTAGPGGCPAGETSAAAVHGSVLQK